MGSLFLHLTEQREYSVKSALLTDKVLPQHNKREINILSLIIIYMGGNQRFMLNRVGILSTK